MSTVPASQVIDQLRWRYATKNFDRNRKISEADWSALEDVLVLTPSSYGLQPWKFFVITNQHLKDSLVPASYNQRQVSDCSHLVVITVPTKVTEEDVDKLIAATAEARGIDPANLDGYRNLMIGDIVTGTRSKDAVGWAKLQSYIALGNFMTAAAMMGIDTCPMEGFIPTSYDEALDIDKVGLTTSVLCPAGYRKADDKYAALPKVRYEVADVVERIE
jgi:nitroreductase